jgi:exodeoxyribonuclease VII large subunit
MYNAAMPVAAVDKRIFSVSELAGAVRHLLEERFPLVWVQGEISNLRIPGSGHWYFTLKDDDAQIRCAMFAGRNRFTRFRPKDGDQVILRGRVSLYEPRGDFQLIAEHLEPAGEGALRAKFEALKQKLAAEGLFDESAKRRLPPYPRHVAVISSRTGAALRDVLSVFRRRCPTIRVTLLPVAVQGRDAEPQIVAAFARIAEWNAAPREALGEPPDVVLLTRGGGSLEDLWAFNLEGVARAVRACPVPVVSAVGHEIDVTIADFAADVRAPTPSAGAELIAPDMAHLLDRHQRAYRALRAHVLQALAARRQTVAHLARRLVDPRRALQRRMQTIDEVERRLVQAWQRLSTQLRGRVALADARLHRFDPARALADARARVTVVDARLARAMTLGLERRNVVVGAASRALNAVSPLATLGRGYAIVTTPAPEGRRWGAPITTVGATQPGAPVVAHLADGRLACTVERIERDAV